MKHLRSVLRFIAALLAMCVVPAHGATWEDANGPHSTVVVAGAGPGGRYYIHRPKALGANAHPIAVLCVGTGSNPRNYDALLAQLASHGVIAIADTDPYQADGSKASAAVNWLLDQHETAGSEYHQKLISSRVLAIGHSSGGNGAMMAATGNRKITSILLYAPALDSARPADLSVPTFYISGSLDATVTPEYVKARYQETSKANAWYGENRNQGHIGFARNPSIQRVTRAWVYTHLLGDTGAARGCFYGPGWAFGNASEWREALKNDNAP